MIHVGDKEVTAIRVGERVVAAVYIGAKLCLLYTSPSPRDST